MMFKLVSEFAPSGDQPEAIEKICKAFESDSVREQTLLGVTGSGKTFTVANVVAKLQKRTLVLAPNKTLAAQLYSEFRQFFPDNAVEYFVSYYDYYQPEAYIPSTDTYIEKDSSINEQIDKLRHSTTKSLLEREDVLVVASVSCIYGIGSPEEYQAHKLTLFVGEEYERGDLLRQLVAMQYTRNDIDFARGNFRVRGEMVEIFPADEDAKVVRLQFFGDLLEEMAIVDPLRGAVIEELQRMTIYPSSHYVVSRQRMESAINSIKVELRERLGELEREQKLLERQRLEQRTLLDIEMLEEMGMCPGIENYSRHLTGRRAGDAPPTLIDFFKRDFLIVVDESHIALPQVRGMYAGDRSRKETLVGHGFRLPSALDNRPLRFDEFGERLGKVLYVSATPGDYEIERCGGAEALVEQLIRPTGLLDPVIEVRAAKHQVEDFLGAARAVIEKGERVLVTTLTKRLAEELTTYYTSAGVRVRYLHSDIDTIERVKILRDLRLGHFDVLVGINLLREGLDLPEVALIGILDADKEGYLRSTRSLIQIMGRAARNQEGRVILYSYVMTNSMRVAIEETKRRRKIQESHNQKHGVIPTSIRKKIGGGIIEALKLDDEIVEGIVEGRSSLKRGGELAPLKGRDQRALDEKILEMKKKMQLLSRKLRFEEAAKLRDEIKKLAEIKLFLSEDQDKEEENG
ncbi:MAG: excinuclease ABC subunit UvrB [Oligoflexia bacterium]|nr:excinuclease ABC subunit UvrB [Oligoflexia bacterium]